MQAVPGAFVIIAREDQKVVLGAVAQSSSTVVITAYSVHMKTKSCPMSARSTICVTTVYGVQTEV